MKFLSLALVAMSLGAFSASAQNKSDNNCNNNCPVQQCENPAQCPEFKKGEIASPFEGLNLTDAQKTKLQELNAKKQAERKQQAEARKADKQQKRDLKMKNDSVKIAARKAAKKEYLEEVKAIIGPDNYVVFLENFYINGNQPGKDKPNKDFRPGKRPADGKFYGQGPKDGKQKAEGDRKDGKGRKEGRKGAPKAPKADTQRQQASL